MELGVLYDTWHAVDRAAGWLCLDIGLISYIWVDGPLGRMRPTSLGYYFVYS